CCSKIPCTFHPRHTRGIGQAGRDSVCFCNRCSLLLLHLDIWIGCLLHDWCDGVSGAVTQFEHCRAIEEFLAVSHLLVHLSLLHHWGQGDCIRGGCADGEAH